MLVHMVAGRLEPREVRRLMRGLDAGHVEGKKRVPGDGDLAVHPVAPFRPFPTRQRRSILHTANFWRRNAARSRAAKAVKSGEIVTLLILSRTALFHQLQFTSDGFWEQRRGQFGKVARTDRLFSITTTRLKAEAERQRVCYQRDLSARTSPKTP